MGDLAVLAAPAGLLSSASSLGVPAELWQGYHNMSIRTLYIPGRREGGASSVTLFGEKYVI